MINHYTVNGVFVHTIYAYSDIEYWFNHFCGQFPEKAKNMSEYSDNKGWSKNTHVHNWATVCWNWVLKNQDKKQ